MASERKLSPGVVLTGLLVVAALVRLPGMTGWAFEPDELSTWRDALSMAGPSANGPGALGRPVYYLLQHFVLAVAPGSPLSLRLPALVFGLLGVWLTWVVARRLFGDVAGVAAGLLVALSP
ncbi:MAG TPA: glycosyltransferase family 39 protein, partial [Gemmatimonadales bacterium]|nr:glycosyltransferase family 39 protein [Gemmatimonadales bacterium]